MDPTCGARGIVQYRQRPQVSRSHRGRAGRRGRAVLTPTREIAMTPCRLRIAFVSLLALVVVVVGSGCGGAVAQNPPAAAPPPGSSQGTDRLASGYLYRFDMTSPANDNFAITTREVYLYFRPDTTAVHFQLENRLGVPIRILWDECTFTDTESRTFKAVHK